jgi:NitT/TauT family transport system ATP-binding protein
MDELVSVKDISYEYGNGSDAPLKILDKVSFDAYKDEFISIIGPSGCGKSTLLRIIAGLIAPNGGEITYRGKRITEPIPEISFVFQDFALMPWLTNLENVKLGLSITRLNDRQKTKRAAALLDSFGLEGFENSYPNVLSGGMKQRVGIARAIASNPKVLLMDEPFSSLDELTANTLRADILNMLKSKKISVNLVIMVTHNVEEAVELSDKIVVLSSKPTYVRSIDDIPLKYPRDKSDRGFIKIADSIYAKLTE